MAHKRKYVHPLARSVADETVDALVTSVRSFSSAFFFVIASFVVLFLEQSLYHN